MNIIRISVKYILLFIIYILFIIGFLYYITIKNKEEYHNIDENKIKLYNFWNMNEQEEKNTISIFKELLNNETLNQYNEIHIYSVFGNLDFEKKPENLYIQYSGESYNNEPWNFDINLIADEYYDTNNKRATIKTILFPHGYFNILLTGMNMDYLLNRRILQQPKTRFCLFCVGNGGNWIRNDFFEKLSKYKKVDSCGSFMNNMPDNERCPSDTIKYLEYISQYKFMICFENKAQKNYLTEKLFNAYFGETIPIYWGCTNVSDYINTNSILYLKPEHQEQDIENLINEIIYLDNNDKEYNNKFNQALFSDGVLPDEFNNKAIKLRLNDLALTGTQ